MMGSSRQITSAGALESEDPEGLRGSVMGGAYHRWSELLGASSQQGLDNLCVPAVRRPM